MIQGVHPMVQALLGSLFTWALTALGAGCVGFISAQNKKLLDVSLGFAAGVMTAASFWSLLAPAIEITEAEFKAWAFFPVAAGFLAGAAFVYFADLLISFLGFTESNFVVSMLNRDLKDEEAEQKVVFRSNAGAQKRWCSEPAVGNGSSDISNRSIDENLRRRVARESWDRNSNRVPESVCLTEEQTVKKELAISWRRIFLLIVAITVHNIPEGLAVGVGFGAVGKSASATFESAWSLALGIGIQNFPEGLAVSLPLAGFGYSKMRSFWYGQLSGMVEPLAAVLGAAGVSVMEPLLPYALSFAAGAMIFVVLDDIIPEAQAHGNGKLASWGGIVGFIVMMSLDVGLG